MMSTARRHVIDLDDFTAEEIEEILVTTESMREVLSRDIKQVPVLRGKTVVTMFFEDSTRTRISFDLAARALSAGVVGFSARGSSVEKGESLLDTVRTLQALGADILVMRHSQSGAPHLVAQHFRGALINAGDGRHAHPSQALLDLYTIRERLGDIRDRHVVIIGDVLHSRVVRSNLWGLSKMGAQITICAPRTLMSNASHWQTVWPTVRIVHELDPLLPSADVLMALRLQKERMSGGLLPDLQEYTRRYALTEERLARAPAHVVVMHPGPMNEGVEIFPEVAVGSASAIEAQVTNGVAVRMALLYRMAG